MRVGGETSLGVDSTVAIVWRMAVVDMGIGVDTIGAEGEGMRTEPQAFARMEVFETGWNVVMRICF